MRLKQATRDAVVVVVLVATVVVVVVIVEPEDVLKSCRLSFDLLFVVLVLSRVVCVLFS